MESPEINDREYRRGNKKWTTRETSHTRRRNTKQKHNTICDGHYFAQTNTNNVNNAWALLQTKGGKVSIISDMSVRFYWDSPRTLRTTLVDMILHGFMLLIIYTTASEWKG